MKHRLIAVALLTLGLVGMSATAAPRKHNCRHNQQCQQQQQNQNQNKMYQPRTFVEFAFEGILLDIDQQTKIDALNAELKAKRQDAAQDSAQCCKRQSGNSFRAEYIAKVKEVLTPDQYTKFLENIALMPQPAHHGKKQHCRPANAPQPR